MNTKEKKELYLERVKQFDETPLNREYMIDYLRTVYGYEYKED